jgi:hypothetical protein
MGQDDDASHPQGHDQTLDERGRVLLSKLRTQRLSLSAQHEALMHAGFTDFQATDLIEGVPLIDATPASTLEIGDHVALRADTTGREDDGSEGPTFLRGKIDYAAYIATAVLLALTLLLDVEYFRGRPSPPFLSFLLASLFLAGIAALIGRAALGHSSSAGIYTYTFCMLIFGCAYLAHYAKDRAAEEARQQAERLAAVSAPIMRRLLEDEDASEVDTALRLAAEWERVSGSKQDEASTFMRTLAGLAREAAPTVRAHEDALKRLVETYSFDVATTTAKEDVWARIVVVDTYREALHALRAWKQRAPRELGRRLAAARMQAHARREYLAGFTQNAAHDAEMFKALDEFSSLVRAGLGLLHEHYGAWAPDEEGSPAFSDAEHQAEFDRIQAAVIEVAERLEGLGQRWEARLKEQAEAFEQLGGDR